MIRVIAGAVCFEQHQISSLHMHTKTQKNKEPGQKHHQTASSKQQNWSLTIILYLLIFTYTVYDKRHIQTVSIQI